MVTKLLLETIRQADSGTVTCVLQTDRGEVRGTIEQSFFEEFFGAPAPTQQVSTARAQRVLQDNQNWLEAEAERQLTLGAQEIVIR